MLGLTKFWDRLEWFSKSKGECRIMAIMAAFQAADAGPIPATRTTSLICPFEKIINGRLARNTVVVFCKECLY